MNYSNNANNTNSINFNKNNEVLCSPLTDSPLIYNNQGVSVSTNKKRNFVHKQVLGVLEQEGYIVEIDNSMKQLEQLQIMEA